MRILAGLQEVLVLGRKMNIKDRIYQILQFNDDLAFSILELFDRVFGGLWIARYFKVLFALRHLERRGLIESKHIKGKKYYIAKPKKSCKNGHKVGELDSYCRFCGEKL